MTTNEFITAAPFITVIAQSLLKTRIKDNVRPLPLLQGFSSVQNLIYMTVMGLSPLPAPRNMCTNGTWGDTDYHTTSVSVLIAIYYHMIAVKTHLARMRGGKGHVKRETGEIRKGGKA